MSRIKSERRNIIGKKSMLFGATVAAIVTLAVISMVFNSIQTSGWPDSAPLEVHGRVLYQNLTPVANALVTLTDDTNHNVMTAYTNDTGWYSITFGGPGGPDWTQGGKLIGMANDSFGNQGTNDTIMPPDNQTEGNIVMNFVIDTPITIKNVGDPHHSHPNYGYYPDYGSNEFYYITLDTPFNFTATDNDGINATYVRIWYNGSWYPEPGTGKGKNNSFWVYGVDIPDNFTLRYFDWAGEGQYYIEFYSDDNNETIQGVEYTHGQWHDVDETEPVYEVWFDEPHSIIHGLDAINCSNAMWVLLYDTGICQSGVEWFNYSVYWNPDEPSGYDWLYDFSIHDNDDYNDYDQRPGYILARLTFDEECFHEIKWRVTDYVGNYGIYDRDIAVDCTEPVITKEFVGPTVDGYLPSQYGEPVWTPNLWLTNHTVIWLNATDLGCGGGAGVCKLGYWIDWNDDLNGTWDDTKYDPVVVPDNSPLDNDPTVGNISVNLTFEYDCVHEIHYWAVDCVGNNYTHKQKHFVDNTPPVIRKDIEKVNKLEQVYYNYSAVVTSTIDDFQSFLAPWSYIDAVSVYLCGYFDPEYPPVLMIWNETMKQVLAYGYPVEIPVDDENYYCGWLQFHLTSRLYTDVGGLYWISVMQNQSTDYTFYWYGYNGYYDGKDKYPDGHAYVNGVENTSWDFTFKIEYYPVYPYYYGYMYAVINSSATKIKNVAIFKDNDPWSLTPDPTETILASHGISYTVFNSSDIGNVDLSGFDKVIISSDQTDSFYDAVESNLSWFEEYAENGGQLEIHAADNAWHYGNWSIMPGGFTHYEEYYNTTDIAMPGHAILMYPNIITDDELDYWWWSSHGYFLDGLPGGSKVVLTTNINGSNEPVFVISPWGNGCIMITTQTLEWAYYYNYSSFLENVLLYCPLPMDYLDYTWVTSEAFFELTTWDEWCMGGVGVKSLKYRIWWNGTWTEWMNYTQPFNLTEECTHYIEIMAEDLLGNVRIINQTHYVDNSPPDLNVEYPDEHGFYYDEETGKQYVRAGKTFYLNLTDEPECAVGWRDFIFYWRYDYTNFTTPYLEEHPADENDTQYGTPVFIDGKWWWVQEPGIPSVALSFDRECRHRIYYFYEASDWLDNSIVSDVEMEEIYVDAYDPVVDIEEPWHHYYEEDVIYLHSDPPLNPLMIYLGLPMYTSWKELYPEYGNYYTWTGYSWEGEYYYNMTNEEGEEDIYESINATITLLLYNDTYGEMYVELYEPIEPMEWDLVMHNPNFTLWHEVYPSFSNLYMILYWQDNGDGVLGYCDDLLIINETDNESIWHVEEVSVDLILKPVPFLRACGKISSTAKDMPDLLKVVDQAQTEGPLQDTIQVYNPVTTPWPWDAQSFKPNASYINSTKLYLNWSAPAEITVYIHDASSWTPSTAIASSTVVLNTSGEGWVEFVFNPGIPVTPNETYYIEVHRSSSSGLVHWYYYAGDDIDDAYPRGNATISGEEENQTERWDWKFQILYWRDNPCASGIEGIYYGYYYNGEWYPRDENDTTEYHTEIVNISIYYDDTVINEEFYGIYLWYVYNDTIGIHFNESCVHDLYYWTKDNVCHHSEIHHKRYRVDKEEPEVNIEFPEHGYAPTYGVGKADIVFVVDTSGSMGAVWTTLDEKMDGLKQQLISQGLDVNVTVYGLASNPSSLNYSYAMTTTWFNGANISAHSEAWGPGTSWCALWYPWREGATRIVIPISDECAYDGGTSEGVNDAFAVDEAKSLCQNNSVIVFPFYHTQYYGSIPEVVAEMEEIANATGGEVNDITELENFSAIFLDVITGAVVRESLRCGAQLTLSAIDKPIEEIKLIDQIQPVGDYPYPLYEQTFNTMQSFIPTADRLDAVSLLLNATYDEVNVSIYDEAFNLLGWNITVVDTWYPAWYQFHFDAINLTPGKTYYIVVTSDYPYHYWWYTNDSYKCGHAYMNGIWMPEYDFAFKTEYYGDGEGICASGIEGIYWRYEYNGTSYPYEMGEGVVNLSNYYPDEPDIANYLWYVYNESNGIVFTEECQHDLYYFAKDNVCHHTKIYHRTFFVDNSLPEINKTHPEHGYEVFPEGFLFEEYFDDGIAGWTDTSGAWITWASNNSGGITPEARGEWPYFENGSMLISPPIDTSGYREATLSFKTYINDYDGINHPYTLHAQISPDGATWQEIWNISPTSDYGPYTFTNDLTWMDGIGSPTFYIAFVYTGDPEGINYWCIDNVTLYGYKAEYLRAGANITLYADDMPEGNCSAGTILKWRFENETGYYPFYYFEGFEEYPVDWIVEDAWWGVEDGHTGNYSMATIFNTPGTHRLVSENISLPPDINIYLTFWHKAENITNSTAANEFDIYIHEDNITIPLKTFSWCYGTLPENWTEVMIDLTPYANKTINLIWTYANGFSPGERWYIDDVEIVGWYEAYGWADVMANISFNECWHKLYYFAKDPVCHTTEIHEQEYYVDGTPPETTHNVITYGWRPQGVICIQDEIEIEVNNSGRMPCIYPFTDTYYRWEWQDENGIWHSYPEETTPGAINGSNITVSSHESEIAPYYWLPYTGIFNFTEGCNHTLYYFSKDELCNTEGVRHWSVGVDDEPPETVMEFQGIHYSPDPEAHYIRNTTIIWLNATDEPNSPFCTVGVNYTLYTIWKYNYSKPGWDVLIPWRSTNDPEPDGIDIFIFNNGTSNRSISIRINLSEIMKPYLEAGIYDTDCGKYEIHWRSVDYNPFYEEEDDRDVIIDCTPPESTKEFGACNVEDILYGEVVHWISSSTPIYINATDDEIWDSGVKKVCIRYKRVDKIPFTVECVNGSSGIFYIPPDDGDGKYRIFHWAVDNVEHSEDYNLTKQHVLLDNTPPTSKVDNITPWRREEVPFNITVVDIEDHGPLVKGEYGAGVCKVEVYYRHGITNATLGDWKLYATYNVPFEDRHDVPNFTFSFDAPDGYGYYRFKSIAYDLVCNEEQPPFVYGTYDAWCYVEYDTYPPNVTKEYGQPCIEWDFGEEVGHAIRSDTPIYLNATDNPDENFTGIDKIFWSFDGIAWHHTSSYNGAKEAHYSFLPSDYGLTEGAVYQIFIFATDMLGHTSNDSSEGQIKQKFVIDDSAPSTSIIIEGNDTMPFNVTVNANDNLVGTKLIKLYYRYSENGITWTTWQEYGSYNGNSYTWQFEYAPYPTYYKPGYYEFYAYAEDYLGNAKSTTPTAEASCYVPPIPEDFNGDGRVNAMDLYNIIVNWGKTPSSPDWSSVQIYDLDNSGKIDAGDIYKLILKWTG